MHALQGFDLDILYSVVVASCCQKAFQTKALILCSTQTRQALRNEIQKLINGFETQDSKIWNGFEFRSTVLLHYYFTVWLIQCEATLTGNCEALYFTV